MVVDRFVFAVAAALIPASDRTRRLTVAALHGGMAAVP
jgi:hypothetical protein